MKIVFICFYEAYPPVSGAASVTLNVAKYAHGERFLIQLGTGDRPAVAKDGVKVITLAGAADSRLRKMAGLRSRIERIAEMLKNISPDVVILEGASWVVYHWLLLRKIRQELPAAHVIYHSHNVEYYLRNEKHGRIVTMLTKWAEGKILHYADLSFAVSEVDSNQFEKLYGVRPHILPNGVDEEMFDRVSESEMLSAKSKYGIGDKAILFMGSYLYKPNREAIDFLVESVMPEVVGRCKDAQLVVIGGDVPFSKPWLLNPGCIPHGQVPALSKTCQVGVAPIFSGSGTRLKILEYMAAEIPVVSTSKGAEGLNVIAGKNVLIADELLDFAMGVVGLLNDRGFAATIAEKGRGIVNLHYSWGIIMERFNREMTALGVGSNGTF